MEERFPRDSSALDAIFEFVEEFFAANGIPKNDLPEIHLIVEELFTNFVKYNAGGEHDIRIRLRERKGAIEIRITDPGAPPFDITKVPEPDVTSPISGRRPGGLGIHFVRKLADRLTYDHSGGDGIVTVVKRLGG